MTSIHISLQADGAGDATFKRQSCEYLEDIEEGSKLKVASQIEEIESRGLPQLLGSEIVTLSRYSAHGFLVLAESQRCIERKLPFSGTVPFSGSIVDDFLADMKLLMMAQGCFGITDLWVSHSAMTAHLSVAISQGTSSIGVCLS